MERLCDRKNHRTLTHTFKIEMKGMSHEILVAMINRWHKSEKFFFHFHFFNDEYIVDKQTQITNWKIILNFCPTCISLCNKRDFYNLRIFCRKMFQYYDVALFMPLWGGGGCIFFNKNRFPGLLNVVQPPFVWSLGSPDPPWSASPGQSLP